MRCLRNVQGPSVFVLSDKSALALRLLNFDGNLQPVLVGLDERVKVPGRNRFAVFKMVLAQPRLAGERINTPLGTGREENKHFLTNQGVRDISEECAFTTVPGRRVDTLSTRRYLLAFDRSIDRRAHGLFHEFIGPVV